MKMLDMDMVMVIVTAMITVTVMGTIMVTIIPTYLLQTQLLRNLCMHTSTMITSIL